MNAKEQMARFAYTLALLCFLPVLAGYLMWRGMRQPDYLKHWSERFLGVAAPRPRHEPRDAPFENQSECTVLWVHAVSVGETRACVPLIAQWLEHSPANRVVLTHTTPTGRETGRALLSKWFESQDRKSCRIVQRYLPYDLPWSNALFLSWARPAAGLLLETELWPNLLAQAQARKISMALVNARLSRRSAKKLRKFSWLARPAIASLAAIAAQTQEDADRLAYAGGLARKEPVVTGNMKFDITVPQSQHHLGNQWRERFGGAHIWCAASTRDDEELALLQAWRSAQVSLKNALLLIVPRHPQRFDRVVHMIDQQGFRPVCRSTQWDMPLAQAAFSVDQRANVLVGDSLGEMFAYLQMSDLVLIGGSIPALGGQNPIEACALGKPVFFGRHMFNFSQIARDLIACGAGAQVSSYADWIVQGEALLESPGDIRSRSSAALTFAQAHRGATQRTFDLLASILPAAH